MAPRKPSLSIGYQGLGAWKCKSRFIGGQFSIELTWSRLLPIKLPNLEVDKELSYAATRFSGALVSKALEKHQIKEYFADPGDRSILVAPLQDWFFEAPRLDVIII